MSRAYTISPDDIREQEFRTKIRGYDPAQVRSYLEELADQVQHMHSQLHDLRMRLSDAQQQLDASMGGSESTDTSIPIRKVAEEYRQEAESDAQGLVARARSEADSLIARAQAQVTELQRDIAELESLRTKIISQIETLLNSQMELLDRYREERRDPRDDNAPEAPPILAKLDDSTNPG